LVNGIRFDVIGGLAKVGQEGNNGTNGRIFVPVETMRNLFPLKEKNTENAISFINYRPLNKAEHLRSKEEVHWIIARLHGFNPKLDDVFEDWDTVENSQRSEEHTSELQSLAYLVCRLLLEKKKKSQKRHNST